MDNVNGIFIIDCSAISEKPLHEIQDTNEFKTFSERFGKGLSQSGIVYLINTGIKTEVFTNFEEKLAEFYSLPVDTKKKYEVGAFRNVDARYRWGWEGPKLLAPLDNKETFDFTSNPNFEDDALYPIEIIGFKEALLEFRKNTRNISTKLLRGLGEYFKLEDKDFFIHQHSALEENFAKSKFSVRTLYYPMQAEIPTNATELRLSSHQDLGTLAHIYQSSYGLQAKMQNGKWVNVECVPNSFVVNAGTSLEMWSGGNIPAVVHRVAWTEKSKTENRLSFGCFLGPDRDACCLPVVRENLNWTPIYTKMLPGEKFEDYFKKQISLINFNKPPLKDDNEK